MKTFYLHYSPGSIIYYIAELVDRFVTPKEMIVLLEGGFVLLRPVFYIWPPDTRRCLAISALLSLNDEFVRWGFDIGPGERQFTFMLLAVSPLCLQLNFSLNLEEVIL